MTAPDGRCWSTGGRGGTLEFGGDGTTRPGPYYMLASPTMGEALVGSGGPNHPELNYRAVHFAVKAIQRALNRELGPGTVRPDGVFGRATKSAVIRWQNKMSISPWGGIGDSSSKLLFMPLLISSVKTQLQRVVCGLVSHESLWDPGTVGYADPDDLGLGQINMPANPAVTEEQAFQPKVAFEYIELIMAQRLETFDGNLGDAIASYNLGAGGALSWIRAGRPDLWQPSPQGSFRNVRNYINTVLSGCPNLAVAKKGTSK